MRDSDAFSWYMERDPALRATVVAVAWLDRSPDWEALKAKVDHATCVAPSFRKRVVEPPLRLATPRWTVDGTFDLSWHLHRIDAPAPHTARTVTEFAARQAMTAFDRARPLWEFTLIDHLAGDRAALVMKLHHSLTDGLGGMELALLLFDAERRLSLPSQPAEPPDAECVDAAGLVRDSIAWNWSRVAGFVAGRARTTVPSALHFARRPISTAHRVMDTTRSIVRTVMPVQQTLSPVMTDRGPGRHLEMIEVQLEGLKRAAAVAGGTVNDGFMASVAGGLRIYHERRGVPVESLRVTLPISIRTPTDPMGGNRITLMRFVVPVGDPDPGKRIHEAHRLCLSAREERSLGYTNAIAGALNLLPQGAVGSMLKHVDVLTSDVPGFPFPVYLGGALLERYVAFGPTIGSSANMTLLSYNGTCYIGVNSDTAAVPDHEVFAECLQEGFEEVLGLGGDHEAALRPLAEASVAVG